MSISPNVQVRNNELTAFKDTVARRKRPAADSSVRRITCPQDGILDIDCVPRPRVLERPITRLASAPKRKLVGQVWEVCQDLDCNVILKPEECCTG